MPWTGVCDRCTLRPSQHVEQSGRPLRRHPILLLQTLLVYSRPFLVRNNPISRKVALSPNSSSSGRRPDLRTKCARLLCHRRSRIGRCHQGHSRYSSLCYSIGVVEFVIHEIIRPCPPAACNPPRVLCFSPCARARSGWSAALAFAPTRRQVPKIKPITPRLPAGFSQGDGAASTSTSAATSTATISSTAVVFAPPSLVESKSTKSEDNAPASSGAPGQGWGRKVKPPSMILEEDVNGFKGRKSGKRDGTGAGGGGKKKGKKVRKHLHRA